MGKAERRRRIIIVYFCGGPFCEGPGHVPSVPSPKSGTGPLVNSRWRTLAIDYHPK